MKYNTLISLKYMPDNKFITIITYLYFISIAQMTLYVKISTVFY